MVQAGAGGPIVAMNRCCHCSAHGHAVGRCRVVRRAEVATRAATLINCARSVAVVAFACTWRRGCRRRGSG